MFDFYRGLPPMRYLPTTGLEAAILFWYNGLVMSAYISTWVWGHAPPEKLGALRSLLHWKKLVVIPKMGYLRHLPLLPQCTATAFVYSKFQYGMNICIKVHNSPKVSQ